MQQNEGKSVKISIHAAREGGDFVGNGLFPVPLISIHAAREGGDLARLTIDAVC